ETAVRPPSSLSANNQPSPVRGPARHGRFLGEELSPDPLSGSSWLVKAVLGGVPAVEIRRDGVLPARPSRVLPLRHGLTYAGLKATCLLDAPGMTRLRVEEQACASREVDCAACRAWQAAHGCLPRRPSPVMDRIRAALEQVFSHAA
ncbi:MAG TPA: hypothetical protein VFG59_10160, partial [Anaeromyxobacter sp.]|nr:hypothetical protein [Anaeromyxobacter sp.]